MHKLLHEQKTSLANITVVSAITFVKCKLPMDHILYIFCPPIVDEDDYECASVLNKHTQDVKKVAWHPHKEVRWTSSAWTLMSKSCHDFE